MLSNCVESNLCIHLRFKVTYTKSQKQWLGICDVCNTKSGKANKVNIWINSIFVEKIFYRRSLMTWNAYFRHFIIFVCMLFWLFIHTRNWPAPICSFWRLNLINFFFYRHLWSNNEANWAIHSKFLISNKCS